MSDCKEWNLWNILFLQPFIWRQKWVARTRQLAVTRKYNSCVILDILDILNKDSAVPCQFKPRILELSIKKRPKQLRMFSLFKDYYDDFSVNS